MSDASLSPSPIPVTLVARVDTLAAAATGPARLASPPAGRLASRTPISMSTPIPRPRGRNHVRLLRVGRLRVPEPGVRASGRDASGATLPGASADRGHAEASAFADSRADSEGTIGSSEFGGLPGAESFLRDAAAQRAWDVVVGLIASDASVDDDDASNALVRSRGKLRSIRGRKRDGHGGVPLGPLGRHGRVFARDASRRGAVVALGGDGAPRGEARGARGAKLTGLGERLVRRGECEPSGEGFRRVGAVRLGPKRFARATPSPGATSGSRRRARGARSTRTRARASARRSRTTRKVTRRVRRGGSHPRTGRTGRPRRARRRRRKKSLSEKRALRRIRSASETRRRRRRPQIRSSRTSSGRRSTAYASRHAAATTWWRPSAVRPLSLSLSPGTPSRRERRARPRRIRPSVRRRSTRRPRARRRATWKWRTSGSRA